MLASAILRRLVPDGATGVDLEALGSLEVLAALAAGPSAGFQQAYTTGPLDLATTHADLEIVPAKVGYYPVMVSRNWAIISKAGTQTTPPTVRAGSDAGHVNFIASTNSTPANASINAGTVPFIDAGPNFPAVTVQRVANAPILFDVTAAGTGTGGYALTAALVFSVLWLPA